MDIDDESHSPNQNKIAPSTQKVSKLKVNASQCYAVFANNLVMIETGLFTGLTAVLVAELHKPDAEIDMSIDDLTWFSSRYFVAPLGCLLAGVVAHNIGNRSTVFVASLLYAVSCLTFYFATDATMLLIAQAFNGLILSMSLGPGFAYIVEITQPHLRSALTASATLLSITSMFLIVLLSNFLHWRMLALVILVFPIAGFVAVCTIPESPHWLASKGKLEEAKTALCWVRGWTTPNNVAPEFEKMKDTYRYSSANIENSQKIKWNSRARSYLTNTFRLLSQRSFCVPLASICFILILRDLAGFHALTTFFIVIFRDMESPIYPNVAGSMFDGARILGALIYIMLINRLGKKKLAYLSLVLAALSYLIISAVLFLREYGIPFGVSIWIPPIMMILSTFSTAAGIDKIVMVLNVELFPTKLRTVGSGIGLFVYSVSEAVGNKLFLYLVDILTLPGVFVMFGVASIFNCIIFHVMFPETEGRTLTEIEEHYNGVRRFKY